MIEDVCSKSKKLKDMLTSNSLEFLMEAHNGLTAKIVERTGFKAIWASGLSISTSFGVRDRNEASWTQVLDTVEFMSDSTEIPILVDGDTGYGDFNNTARLVKKLSQRGIGGVCIEDKLFPKQNSFVGEKQPLLSIDDFTAKIKAGKDAQRDNNFCFVARIEALISGYSMQEALDRADAYRSAGADAILIHSKKSNADEIAEFCTRWNNACPVVIVPTKYYQTPVQVFRDLNVSAVIWANHNMRAAVSAMSLISQQIFERQSIDGVEGTIATLSEIFELTGEHEFKSYANKYLT